MSEVRETPGSEAAEAAGTVAEAVKKVVAQAVEAAESLVESAAEVVSEAVTSVVEPVVAAVQPVLEKVTEAVQSIAEEAAAPDAEPEVAPEAEAVVERLAEVAIEAPAAEAPAIESPAAEATPEAAVLAESAPKSTPAPRSGGRQGGRSDKPVAVLNDDSVSVETAGADGQRVVKTLAVGQDVKGTVKRVSEFGAFVDIGVGRDGLVHISEMSVKRVGKVTDVLTEGQEVQLWIKKLDRERNRISLTMIAPGTTTLRDLNKDDLVTGTVTRILPYGAFVDIGVGRDALLHVREMGERYIAKPEEVVKVGEQIEARIIEIQRRRGRIDLSIKGLRPEPEMEVQPQYASAPQRGGRFSGPSQSQQQPQAPAPEPEPEADDPYSSVEVISPMELAFRKAMQESGVELNLGKKRDKRDRKERTRAEQEAIFERTLKQSK